MIQGGGGGQYNIVVLIMSSRDIERTKFNFKDFHLTHVICIFLHKRPGLIYKCYAFEEKNSQKFLDIKSEISHIPTNRDGH